MLAPTDPLAPTTLRSPLGRARGLGSAKSGLGHWWAQRLSALALVPLSLWFIFSMLALAGAPHAAVLAWFGHPLPLVLLLCLVLGTFHHMQLGLQVVIEDYIHSERLRLAGLVLMKGAVFLLGLTALIAALKIGF